MKRPHRHAATIAVVSLLATACAARSTTTAVQPRVTDLHAYSTLALAVDSRLAEDVHQETNAIAVRALDRMRAVTGFRTLRLATDHEMEPGTLVMRATVTNVKKVGTGTRFLVGALAGRARVTLDVKLIDAPTGAILESHTVVGESGGTGLSGGTGDAVDKAAEALSNLVVG